MNVRILAFSGAALAASDAPASAKKLSLPLCRLRQHGVDFGQFRLVARDKLLKKRRRQDCCRRLVEYSNS
jgi:hypothetical protein